MTIDLFLLWLTTGGSIVAVSWIAEQFPKWATLPPQTKKWIQYIASSLLGCAALAVTLYVPKEVLERVTPYFAVVVTTFTSIFLNQVFHTVNRNLNK